MCKLGNETEVETNQNIRLSLKHCILLCRLTSGGNDKPEHNFAFWLFIQVNQGKTAFFIV